MQKILALLILVGISTAYASTFDSTYNGVIREIRMPASSSDGKRVSVLTTGTTDCARNDGWYSFKYLSVAGPGAAWLGALQIAKTTALDVVIQGTGTCDASGIEQIAAIDLPIIPNENASNDRDLVQEIRIAASPAGGTRVSVLLTSGTTNCQEHGTSNRWYSFEYSSALSPGVQWLADLMAAGVNAERVVIHGTGTCDAYGMEQVAAINLNTAPLQKDLLDPPPKVLRARIDRASLSVAQPLSGAAREEMRRALARFYAAMAARCGAPPNLEGLRADSARCLHGEYFNYLAHVPDSVYRVDGYAVFETGIYGVMGAMWDDDDLQKDDSVKVTTDDLRVTWPRIDTSGGRSNPLWSRAMNALAHDVHEGIAGANGIPELYLDVRLETLNACYVSARITSSASGGGAHPFEDYDVFNWNLDANRELMNEDLFRADSDWRHGILGLYRQHLGVHATEVTRGAFSATDEALTQWIEHHYLVTTKGLKVISHEWRRMEPLIPDVDLTWAELKPWLSPNARCTDLRGAPR